MNINSKRAAFYHDLAVMLEAGLPILRSLSKVIEGQQGHYKIIFSEIHKSISQGNSISEAMADHKKAFDRLDVMMVETAEMSGKLPECFRMLANWYEFRNRLRGIVIKGLTLPCLVLSFAAFVLPVPGLVLGSITFNRYLFEVFKVLAFFYLLLIMFPVAYKLLQKNRNLKKMFDSLILRIPIVSQAVLQLSVSRCCRAFNMLYKAGVPIIESLSQASKLAGNMAVSGFFENGAKSAAEGNTAFEGFSGRLPSEYLNLWQIGEESGELEKTVDKIAEISGDKAEVIFTELARWFTIAVYVLVSIWMIIEVFKGYSQIYSTQGLY